jgi:hypothetical protein
MTTAAVTGRRRIRVVPVVKAYPEPSQRHGETVCVAGVRTDVHPNCWIRMWPIDFRGLPFDEQFRKYEEIQLDVLPPTNDRRPESCRPVAGSITPTGRIFGTERGWAARWELIEPLMVPSMCDLRRRQDADAERVHLSAVGVSVQVPLQRRCLQWSRAVNHRLGDRAGVAELAARSQE